MKNFYRKLLSVKSGLAPLSLGERNGLYACLAFFSFGLMSILPDSSQINPDIFVSEAKPLDTVTAEQTSKDAVERCRLQADVALFFALREQKASVLQADVSCEKKHPVLAGAPGKASRNSDETLQSTIREMTAGYPVERMVLSIATYDRGVAALIVGIAKKESNWGKRVPLDAAGNDCFNYWGYKGAGSRGIEMGHGCFGSPEEAVAAVGDRLTQLVALRRTSEPKNMIIWKCGASCQGHSSESVKKWIADVSLYYDRIAIK
ncbi:MAG: hypothetical protein Q8Q10_00650 [bacterium]|nr:hypothetical protein [bacterium]